VFHVGKPGEINDLLRDDGASGVMKYSRTRGGEGFEGGRSRGCDDRAKCGEHKREEGICFSPGRRRVKLCGRSFDAVVPGTSQFDAGDPAGGVGLGSCGGG